MDSASEPVAQSHVSSRSRVKRWIFLLALGLVPLLTPVLSPKDDGLFMYPYCGALELLSAVFCLLAARREQEEARRWRTIAVAQTCAALSYWSGYFHIANWLTTEMRIWMANAFAGAAKVLFLPAMMRVRGDRDRVVNVLDITLLILTCGLLMLALGSGLRPGDGNVRVLVGFFGDIFMMAAAIIVLNASDSRALRHFSIAMAVYLSARLASAFLVNVVSYMWLSDAYTLFSDLIIPIAPLLL